MADKYERKTDCILFDRGTNACIGLNRMYCKTEKCGFYKSKEEYNKDGTKKQIRK